MMSKIKCTIYETPEGVTLEQKQNNDRLCKLGFIIELVGIVIACVGGGIINLPYQLICGLLFVVIVAFISVTVRIQGDVDLIRNRNIYIATSFVLLILAISFILEGKTWGNDPRIKDANYMYFITIPIAIVHYLEMRLFRKHYGRLNFRKWVFVWSIVIYAFIVYMVNSFWSMTLLIPVLTAYAQCENIKIVSVGCAISNLTVIYGGLIQTQYYDTGQYWGLSGIVQVIGKIFKQQLQDRSKYMLYIYVFIVAFLILYSMAVTHVISYAKKFNDAKMDVIVKEQGRIKKLVNKVIDIGMRIKSTAFGTGEVVKELDSSINNVGFKLLEIQSMINRNKHRIERQEKKNIDVDELIVEIHEQVDMTSSKASETMDILEDEKRYFIQLKDTAARLYDYNRIIDIVIDEFVANVSEVGSITEGIDYILDETHLLSYNTSIKSAKAKEYGKSFAVIASEIRSLASQTLELTSRISSIVYNLSASAELTKRVINEVMYAVDEENITIEETADVFKLMRDDMVRLTTNITSILEQIDKVYSYNKELKYDIENLDVTSEEVVNYASQLAEFNKDNLKKIIVTNNTMKELLARADKFEEIYYKTNVDC